MILIDKLKNYRNNLKTEILSGITSSLAMVPEVVAFCVFSRVSPLVGLYSAIIIGFITSVLGGRPGMISGAAGAIAVVIVSLVADHGVEYLFAAAILMGVIQIVIGFLKLGKFIRLVPQSVMYGFLNGLAIVFFIAQLNQFQIEAADGTTQWLQGTPLYTMIGFVALTMAIIYFLPKVTRAVPAALTAIIVVSAIVIFFQIPTKTVGDIASIAGALPEVHIPQVPLTWDTLMIVFPYSLIMAIVGLIETLLTLNVVDEMTETRGRGNKETVAQGIANSVSGIFGGTGGCAMIGQSIVNISSGGRNRVSGVTSAIAILLFVVIGSSWIEKIPMAAMVGLMFMVAIGTFEWASLKIVGKVPLTDIIVMVIVAGITAIFHNLAVAVIAGVIISALAFAWENAKRIRARKTTDEKGIKHYEIFGPLFFGSVTAFYEKFDVQNDPSEIVIDFKESRIMDHSAIEALNKITEKYAKVNKKVHLRHLSEDCRVLLNNASAIIDVNYWEDPQYKVVSDRLG